MTTTNVVFRMRRDTTANWASYNPRLAEGEIGIDTDLNKFKIGKKIAGVLQTWSQLGYANILASDLTAGIADHNSQTTNVHGIANTANLATQTYVNSAVTSLSNTVDNTYVPISDVGNADGVAPLDANTQIPTTYLANVTKTFIGLGNVNNTSDTNKPISTATQSALDLKAPLASPTFTGTVSGITKGMVGLGNVDNTSDTNKPISTATQTALDTKLSSSLAATTYETITNVALKAPLSSPTFTGTPLAPTAIASTNTTQIATTQFVKTAIDNLINSAPGALDTLGEIATQLATDESAVSALTSTVATKAPINNPTLTGTVTLPSTTTIGVIDSTELSYLDGVTSNIQTQLNAKLASSTAASTYATITNLNLKAPLASPTFTGTPIAPTASAGTNTTQVATTEFVQVAAAAINSSLNTTNSNVTTLTNSVNTTNANVTSLTNSVNTTNTNVANLTTSVNTLSTRVNQFDARIVSLELGLGI